jgi:hypothetical protein
MFVDSFQTGTLGIQDNKYIFIIYGLSSAEYRHFVKTDSSLVFYVSGKNREYYVT